MNKQECKKYITRTYNKLSSYIKDITPKDIEITMRRIISEETEEYIAYSKIALNNILNSGNLEITTKELVGQIDILPKIYSRENAIEIANKL